MSKRYAVAVQWTMEGTFYIEADSPQAAAQEAYERQDFPQEESYSDNSFTVISTELDDEEEEEQ